MKGFRAGLTLALLGLASLAHGQTIMQSGAVSPGHVPVYSSPGGAGSQVVARDGGSAAGGGWGYGVSEFAVQQRGTGTPPYAAAGNGPFGTNVCDYDGPIGVGFGYHFLCLSPNAGANAALLAVGAAGGATPGPLVFNVNGLTYTLDPYNRESFTGGSPAVSSCGASPSIDAYATDNSGVVTAGTGSPTSCTITFGHAFSVYNHCLVTFETATLAGAAYSFTKTAITLTATNLSGTVAAYRCDGQ